MSKAAERIIDTLRQANEPLMQADIAHRAGLIPASTRRTCQGLIKSGQVVVADYNGWMGNPRLSLPIPVAEPAVVDRLNMASDS